MAEYSYNGWPASPDKKAINIVTFGDAYGVPFPGGVRDGDVKTVLGYVCIQLHQRVEACISGWDWGYQYRANVNNPNTLSCHASGTAIDYNAPLHPNGASGTFTAEQRATIYDILAEVQGAVQWGGDYTGTKDEMHFEIIVDAATLARVAAQLPSDGTDDDMPLSDEDIDKIAKKVWEYQLTSRVSNSASRAGDMLAYTNEDASKGTADKVWDLQRESFVSKQPAPMADIVRYIDQHTQ